MYRARVLARCASLGVRRGGWYGARGDGGLTCDLRRGARFVLMCGERGLGDFGCRKTFCSEKEPPSGDKVESSFAPYAKIELLRADETDANEGKDFEKGEKQERPLTERERIEKEYQIEYSRSMRRKPFALPRRNRKDRERWVVKHPKVVVARQYTFKYGPRKMNFICKLVRRIPVEQARMQLTLLHKKGAPMLLKLLDRGIACALVQKNLKRNRLIVDQCWVTKGQYRKKIDWRGKGHIGIIKRYTCHVTLILRELDEVEWVEKVGSAYVWRRFRPANSLPAPLLYNLPKTWLIRPQIDASAVMPNLDTPEANARRNAPIPSS